MTRFSPLARLVGYDAVTGSAPSLSEGRPSLIGLPFPVRASSIQAFRAGLAAGFDPLRGSRILARRFEAWVSG